VSTPSNPSTAPTGIVGRYALVMGAATVLSIGAGLFAASAGGGDTGVLTAVAAVLAASAGISLAPVLARPPWVRLAWWGMVVLGAMSARMLMAIAGMLVLIEVLGLPKAAVVYGLLTGTLLVMAAEAGAAVWLLNRRTGPNEPLARPDSTSLGEARRTG
jgi:hypothetical protein